MPEDLLGEGSTLIMRAIAFFGWNEGTRIAREKGRALRINSKSYKINKILMLLIINKLGKEEK